MQGNTAQSISSPYTASYSDRESLKHCLLVKHSSGWQDDRCERWLHCNGYTTHTHIGLAGQPLPNIKHFSHVVVYGGTACIGDKHHRASLKDEMRFIESVINSNLPCLGICLGAQLIAHVLGAEVKPLDCGTTEFGFSRITPTDAGGDFMHEPCSMLQWHRDGFDLPDSCTLLATGELFPNQAFLYGDRTYGIQFHPEVTVQVLKHWHSRNFDDGSNDEVARARQLRDCKAYSDCNQRWFEYFLPQWATAG